MFLFRKLGGWLYAALAFLGVLGATWVSGKREGRSQAETRALKDSAKRQEKGREAVEDLRGADRDELVDRVRRNDGQW